MVVRPRRAAGLPACSSVRAPEAAKAAYIALMKYHGYPAFADVRAKLWVSDH
mgnify:CR=1 FL=1